MPICLSSRTKKKFELGWLSCNDVQEFAAAAACTLYSLQDFPRVFQACILEAGMRVAMQVPNRILSK